MFESLHTTGYAVVKDWLTSSELAACLSNLSLARAWADANGSSNGNYNVMADQQPHPLSNKIADALSSIRTLGFKTDAVRSDAIYFDTAMFRFPWHQDHEPWFQYWDNYNMLTFWIPLVKPDPVLAGLSLIPMDQLKARIGPEVYDRFEGKGAKLVDVLGSRTLVTDDYKGDKFWLEFDINSLAVSPEMLPGDLLVFRGDVLHRSQGGGHRAAMGVRTFNSQARVYRRDLYDCSNSQKMMMAKNPRGYAHMFRAFEQNPDAEYLLVRDL